MDTLVEEAAQHSELEVENKKMALALQEKEKLLSIAHKVAHDICSPLAVLKMMVQSCNELPPEKIKLINRATESIVDIANQLLTSYRYEKERKSTWVEPRQPLRILDLITQVIDDKKLQFQEYKVQFEVNVDSGADTANIQIQKTAFCRMMSNLINNAVDAVEGMDNALVVVNLSADADSVIIKIEDNGKGMSDDIVEKVLGRERFTDGKLCGHGLGLQQVWDTLEHNYGTMVVKSCVNNGTCFKLAFRRILEVGGDTNLIEGDGRAYA